MVEGGRSDSLLVVMTTVNALEQAQTLAQLLVQESLVACAQILPPMTSIYRWQGKVEEETEVLLLLKLPAAGYPRLAARLQQIHPYQEPEVVAVTATAVSQSYLSWAIQQTQPESPPFA